MGIWDLFRGRKVETRTDSLEGRIPGLPLTAQFRADEWNLTATGHGITGVDPRTEARFVCARVPNSEARDLWAGDPLATKLIELLPKAMVREGYKTKIADQADEKAVSTKISDAIDTLGINRAFVKAKEYERAYGGAAIWPILNDGVGDLAQPLNENAIATVREYHVFEPRELTPATWYQAGEPKTGQIKTYTVTPIATGGIGAAATQAQIHESRLVIFEGIRVSRELPQVESFGWGDSELTRVRAVLRDYHMDWSSVHALFKDLSQGVYGYEGLTELLAQADGEALVKRRLAVNDYGKSVFNALVLDSRDRYERKTTSLSGTSEILVQQLSIVAAAFGMPVTKLFGVSPGGLNATGDSDTRGWYETVGEEQEDDRPLLERLIRFSLLAIDGPTGGKEPDAWRVEFAPLWAPSEKETAETRYTNQQADNLAIDAQMVTPDEVARARWGGDTYSPDMHIDWAAREAQARAGEAEIAAGTSNDVQAQALNGAQIAALLDIIAKVANKEISRESGAGVIVLSFPGQIDDAKANELLGPVGFVPAAPEPKANPFGGGPPKQPELVPGKPTNGKSDVPVFDGR